MILYVKTYSKRFVQPYFKPLKWTKIGSIIASKVFISTKILLWNFLNSIDTFIFSKDFMLIGLCFFVFLLWIIEFVKELDIHKMDWIFQKWPTITMYILKLYIIRCCQAFLAFKLPFKSHCLYAYSYFCGLKHSKSHCFLCQLTKINFGTPMQKYVSHVL